MSSSTTELVEVVMPRMGVSISEGTVTAWLVGVGDTVAADQPICELSTDKTDVEVPSPAAGAIRRICVGAGETVTVGTPLAEIGPEDADRPSGAGNGEIDRSGFHSPVVRRIAAAEGVELEQVDGHGVGGRIRKQDLLAFIDAGEHGASPQVDEVPAPQLHSDSPYEPEPEPEAGHEPRQPPVEAGETRVELDPMRAAIGRHMLASRRTAPHCTTVVEVDFNAIERSREELGERMRERGVPLTYLAYVAIATVGALADHPVLNASIEDEEMVFHNDVNLGIAVAVESGLIVPVIARAQRLSLEGMAAAIGDLAGRARAGELRPEELTGGTFTITNPGRHGALIATPIINQPEVAILDLEAIVRRPVAISDDDGESIAIRPMSYLCMSWDHRALDGVAAARFLGDLRARMEGGEWR